MAWRRSIAYLLALIPASCWLISPMRLGIVWGNSMSPSMKNGQSYLLDEAYYRSHAVRRGEVVVFRRDGLNYIKRVVAGPGDTLYVIRSDNADEVVMDWELAGLRRLLGDKMYRRSYRLVSRQVPPGCCYVLGDNLDCSIDSRSFGPILLESIRGKVLHAAPPCEEVEHVAGDYRTSGTS